MFLSSGSGMKCRYYTNQPKQIKNKRIGQIVRVYCAWTLWRKAFYKVQTQRTFFVQGSKASSLCHKIMIYNPFIFAIFDIPNLYYWSNCSYLLPPRSVKFMVADQKQIYLFQSTYCTKIKDYVYRWAGTVEVPVPVLKGCIVMVPVTLLKKMLTTGTVNVLFQY